MKRAMHGSALLRSILVLALVLFGAPSCGDGSPLDVLRGEGEPVALDLSPDSLFFHALGDSTQLAAAVRDAAGGEVAGATVAWTVLDPGAATVRPTGWVVATSNGTARVVASAGPLADTVRVEVAQVMAAVELSPNQPTLGVGDTLRLEVAVTDSNGVEMVDVEVPDVEWASTNEEVATVDEAGLVTALRIGAAVVSATVNGLDGGDASFSVLDRIAFETDRHGNREIYVMYADGSGQVNLTKHPGGDGRPVWSPDGTRIAFRSDRDGNSDIFVMNADGSDPVNLTKNGDNDFLAAWSPDGSRIAFRGQAASPFFNLEILALSTDGSGPANLTNSAGLDTNPVWSPDGSRIAFVTQRDGNYEIYVMNADGGGPINLTKDAYTDDGPVWSPDGTKIAFITNRNMEDFEIWVMDADGGGPINLTKSARTDTDPAWLPDGTKIAFTTDRDGNREVYIMNADGSGQVNLTNHPGRDDFRAWSPDGTQIAFTSERDGNREVYVMNADGSGQVNLTNSLGDARAPTWQPRR